MGERKNIFLLARRGHERDEDQLTELLAFLWQQEAETLPRWLSSLDRHALVVNALGDPNPVCDSLIQQAARHPSDEWR